MFARFDENPAMTLQDIKKTKRYGRTHARTHGRTDGQRENSIPSTNKVCGGIKNLEMRPEVNVKVKVTQNGLHHSAIPRGIKTPNLGFLHQILLEICSRHDFSRN